MSPRDINTCAVTYFAEHLSTTSGETSYRLPTANYATCQDSSWSSILHSRHLRIPQDHKIHSRVAVGAVGRLLALYLYASTFASRLTYDNAFFSTSLFLREIFTRDWIRWNIIYHVNHLDVTLMPAQVVNRLTYFTRCEHWGNCILLVSFLVMFAATVVNIALALLISPRNHAASIRRHLHLHTKDICISLM